MKTTTKFYLIPSKVFSSEVVNELHQNADTNTIKAFLKEHNIKPISKAVVKKRSVIGDTLLIPTINNDFAFFKVIGKNRLEDSIIVQLVDGMLYFDENTSKKIESRFSSEVLKDFGGTSTAKFVPVDKTINCTITNA